MLSVQDIYYELEVFETAFCLHTPRPIAAKHVQVVVGARKAKTATKSTAEENCAAGSHCCRCQHCMSFGDCDRDGGIV
jgi:hypothetical protein